jgi:hypothetical protein
MIYRCKRNLAGIYLGRCGGNWVTEDVEISLPAPWDTGRHDAQRWRNLQPSWQEGLKEMSRTGQTDTGQWFIFKNLRRGGGTRSESPYRIDTFSPLFYKATFMSQVYALFTVLKCNLVFVFCCFFHSHFLATCFGNSLPSSGMVPLTISLQFIVKIDV